MINISRNADGVSIMMTVVKINEIGRKRTETRSPLSLRILIIPGYTSKIFLCF